MEIAVIAEFLTEHGYPNRVDRRLRPPRIILDCFQDLQPVICINDGDLFLEELTRCGSAGCRPLAVIALADPDSLDHLLDAIKEHCGPRDVLGEGPGDPGHPTDAGGSGLRDAAV